MEMSRIFFLFILLFLFIPSLAAAQTSRSVTTAANKSWKPFWTQFTAAVKSKNKAAVKQLMVAERDFSNGAEGGTRNQWLKNLDKQKLWGEVQRTVAKGTKLYNSGEKIPWRVTMDDSLLFVFEKGSWRFFGVRGDE
ncbi:MAG: hypothetical protein WA584_16725 [Pyrinomonadaceae bacterium]